ncbi:MAG: DoxX family membrane protein [Actinomycetales bacterium]|jgi:uncharacterized membrane protein YphA (DoxX/SURF4 family)|nr:DoxX family membrane protein [Actinomycetales bacterium]
MLSRRIARPLLAAWFVAEGVDAARHPDAHVERLRGAWRRLAKSLDLPQPPPTGTLRTIAQAHGGATAAAGILLALGKAPRTAATALVLLTLPVAAMDAPTRGGSDDEDDRGPRPFLRDLSLVGGAAIAALDREGHPSLGWRLSHARAGRAAAAR